MNKVPRWLKAFTLAFASMSAALAALAMFATGPMLFPAGRSYIDILVYKGRFTLYHSAKFFTSRAYSAFAYPAGAAPIYQTFYKTPDPVATYLIVAAAITCAAVVTAFFFLKRRGATALLLPIILALSFPLIFLIQRANIELILWLLVGMGLIAYRRGLAVLAAILFGLAAAVKLYPILLLGLFLTRRRDVPALVVGVVTFVGSMAAAIAFTGPTFSLAANGFFTGVNRFQDHYVDVVSKVEIAFDHCLFSPLKAYAYVHHTSPAAWKPAYFFVAAILTTLLFLRVRKLPFLNRVVFLTSAMVCLPPVSFTYTLVHLYVPTFFLLGALLTQRRPPATAVMALILLFFLALPIVGLAAIDAGLATGPIQAFALLALLILCALVPWPEADIVRPA
jgi:uncharacterized membrane protein